LQARAGPGWENKFGTGRGPGRAQFLKNQQAEGGRDFLMLRIDQQIQQK